MHEHERDDVRQGDAGDDDPEWDESSFDLVDRIERGEFPIEIPCTIDLPPDKLGFAKESSQPDDAPPMPLFPPLEIILKVDQSKLREIAIEIIDEAGREGRSKLGGLALLARIDGSRFLDTAARHFADTLAEGDDSLRSDPLLGDFIVDLHERGADRLVDVVERALALDRAAGERLRRVILNAINEPPCRDALGLLAVAALADRLETL
jgi:hypothetical protein